MEAYVRGMAIHRLEKRRLKAYGRWMTPAASGEDIQSPLAGMR